MMTDKAAQRLLEHEQARQVSITQELVPIAATMPQNVSQAHQPRMFESAPGLRDQIAMPLMFERRTEPRCAHGARTWQDGVATCDFCGAQIDRYPSTGHRWPIRPEWILSALRRDEVQP